MNSVCVTSDGACGECQACAETGACVPTAGGACVAEDPVCAGKVWGASGGLCLRFAGKEGTCDLVDGCVLAPAGDCVGQGSVIAECVDAECVKTDLCVMGADADSVLSMGLCANGPTDACGVNCFDRPNTSTLYHSLCGLNGTCAGAGDESCKGYKCAGPKDCGVTCKSDADCVSGYHCDLSSCKL